jgi:hypothetical protein
MQHATINIKVVTIRYLIVYYPTCFSSVRPSSGVSYFHYLRKTTDYIVHEYYLTIIESYEY